MSRDRSSAALKRRANVTPDGALLDAARALDQAVRAAQAGAWRAANADAMARRATWVEVNSLPLATWQSWKP